MSRLRVAKKPKSAEFAAKNVGQEVAEKEPTIEQATPDNSDKPMSKVNAVRAALAEGVESPVEATDFIKKRFGLEVSRQHFSATKSQLKKKEGAVPKGGRGRKKAAVESYLAPSPKQRATDGEGDLIESLETLKPLIAQHGAEKVHRLVDLLG